MTFEQWFNQMKQHWPNAEAMREAFRQAYMLGYTHGWDDGESLQEDDAAEFSPGCWPDTKETVLRGEITRLTNEVKRFSEAVGAYCESRRSDTIGAELLKKYLIPLITHPEDPLFSAMKEVEPTTPWEPQDADRLRAAMKAKGYDWVNFKDYYNS